jgi:hypothetical protein
MDTHLLTELFSVYRKADIDILTQRFTQSSSSKLEMLISGLNYFLFIGKLAWTSAS